jgi:hypothetical protein
MNRRTALAALATPLALGAAPSTKAGPQLAHMVFFSLKERSEEGRKAFVALCDKYLSGHAGVAYFSVGTIAEDAIEPGVGVRDFDVALHLVFDDKEAKEKYLKSTRHDGFVAEIKSLVGHVRVYDSYLAVK